MNAIFSPSDFLREHPEVLDPRRPIDEEEHERRYIANRQGLLWRAYDAAARAISYRNFRVGCAVLAWREILPEEDPTDYLGIRWNVFTGSNLKVTAMSRTICAEQVALQAARQAHYTRILGIAVVGEPQEDGESGLTHATLHPCQECRAVMQALPEVRSDTWILTGRFGDNEQLLAHEEMTFAKLLVAHNDKKEGTWERK